MASEWTTAHTVVVLLIALACVNYLTVKMLQKSTEGFEDKQETEDLSVYTWITEPNLIYDDFYAGVYDQLTNQADRSKAKATLLATRWGQDKSSGPISSWSILDAGCGTGYGAVTFAKLGAGKIVGLDSSPAMLRFAQTKVEPAAKLNKEQTAAIRWREGSLENPSACAAGEFSHIYMFYFTFYYLKNPEEWFRFANLWTKPGGKLVIEVVNKYKFDPILESASPFMAFSLQKYSKERIKKSKVTFDKFEYEARFELTDPKAEFYETFRFKDNAVRRQKHIFQMPKLEEVVKMAKGAGWKYVGYQDLNAIGFEYAYLLEFTR